LLWSVLLALAGAGGLRAQEPPLAPVPGLGIGIQAGFAANLYADADLADDIEALAIDSQGRVVVGGPGYVKTLLDPEDTGRAVDAIMYAPLSGSCGGLCFDGAALFCAADGWLARFEDTDGDGRADRPPARLLALRAGEHGAHGIRIGPDGFVYVAAGEAGGVNSRAITALSSPVREPEGGTLVRLRGDGQEVQILAQGFRNPRGFDFDPAGETILCDAGTPEERGLPWEIPARLLQAIPGGHSGWRLGRRGRGWARPEYYADTLESLAELGRGLPSGLAAYRHRQFPERFRSGVFVTDWAGGRVWFVALEPEGAGYRAHPEVFLEALHSDGFTPSGIAVGANGSVYVSSGGRRSRGQVLRIDYAGPPSLEAVEPASLDPELNEVLQAPQPLEAWSRAEWAPVARRLGPGPFQRIASDEWVDPRWRARAIEALTELFGGLPQSAADMAARAASPLVRARAAWSLGQAPGPTPALFLLPLLEDPHPLPRRCALEALASQVDLYDNAELPARLVSSLGFPDKQVRLAASHAASRLSTPSWQRLQDLASGADPGTRLHALMARFWREPAATHPELLAPLASVLSQTREPPFRRDALRLIILALGDWNLRQPTVDLAAPVETGPLPAAQTEALARIRALARAALPAGDEQVDVEAARLLAMLRDGDARAARVLAGFLTPTSAAEMDLHWLSCLARWESWPADLAPRIAEALLGLERKQPGPSWHPSESWPARRSELFQALAGLEPRLPDLLVEHPQLLRPGNLWMVAQLDSQRQQAAARKLLAAAQADGRYPWSPALLETVALLPEPEARPALRAQWDKPGLRDDLLLYLAARPGAREAELYWQGLASGRPEVARACAQALAALRPGEAGTNLVASFGLLRRLVDEPRQKGLRATLLGLIETQTGERFAVNEPEPPPRSTLTHAAAVKSAWEPVFGWLAKKRPALHAGLAAERAVPVTEWAARLRQAPWKEGMAARGARVALARGCATCHSGPSGLGPSLGGLADEWSEDELFAAMVLPSLDIDAKRQPVSFLMRDGSAVSGLVLFDSAEVTIVQTGPDATTRLEGSDIRSRQPARVSFMPEGLLDPLPPEALADLLSFLKSLPSPHP